MVLGIPALAAGVDTLVCFLDRKTGLVFGFSPTDVKTRRYLLHLLCKRVDQVECLAVGGVVVAQRAAVHRHKEHSSLLGHVRVSDFQIAFGEAYLLTLVPEHIEAVEAVVIYEVHAVALPVGVACGYACLFGQSACHSLHAVTHGSLSGHLHHACQGEADGHIPLSAQHVYRVKVIVGCHGRFPLPSRSRCTTDAEAPLNFCKDRQISWFGKTFSQNLCGSCSRFGGSISSHTIISGSHPDDALLGCHPHLSGG